jgi:hypothetical protein
LLLLHTFYNATPHLRVLHLPHYFCITQTATLVTLRLGCCICCITFAKRGLQRFSLCCLTKLQR